MLFLISIATFFSTLFGGLFALKFKDKLHIILGFSAGAVIGVAFFDLMPEAINLGSKVYSISSITTIIAIGFITYLILDRFASQAHSHDNHEHDLRGSLGAASLSIHSFLDGVAIGVAFQVSTAVGALVAIAVLVHDFSDGINTVNLILKNNGKRMHAVRWLLIDALAPVFGVTVTLFFTLSESTLGILLAIFSGFFLYIGASDLLPESHHNHPRALTTIMTIVGIGILYLAIRLANI